MGRDDWSATSGGPQWETVTLRDLTDCLLDAYDLVSQRAYQRYVRRGRSRGRELDDWLGAERDLIGGVRVTVEDAPAYVSALATVPAHSAAEVEVGIESRRLVILSRPRPRAPQPFELPVEFPFASIAGESTAIESPEERNGSAESLRTVFSVIELPAEVDPAASVAVLSNGLLGIRMIKKNPRAF